MGYSSFTIVDFNIRFFLFKFGISSWYCNTELGYNWASIIYQRFIIHYHNNIFRNLYLFFVPWNILVSILVSTCKSWISIHACFENALVYNSSSKRSFRYTSTWDCIILVVPLFLLYDIVPLFLVLHFRLQRLFWLYISWYCEKVLCRLVGVKKWRSAKSGQWKPHLLFFSYVRCFSYGLVLISNCL